MRERVKKLSSWKKLCTKEKVLILSNFSFSYNVFRNLVLLYLFPHTTNLLQTTLNTKKLSAAEASEIVYMWERVKSSEMVHIREMVYIVLFCVAYLHKVYT